jgi:phenylacetate-CoA ligase
MHEAEQRREFEVLVESQFLSHERLRDLQRARLEPLLRHARAHVPFYGDRLARLFDGNTIRWERWEEVPIVSRDDLRLRRAAMLARDMPREHGRLGAIDSTGSTGANVTTSHTSLSLSLSEAATFRAMTWLDVDYTQTLAAWFGTKASIASYPEGVRRDRWGPWWDKRSTGPMVQANRFTDPADFLEFMQRHGASYFDGGGTDIRLLAHEALRRGITVPLKAAFTRSADVTAPGRAMVAEAFGAKAYSVYASKEGHRIAHECPTSGHYHINDEQLLLEIIDENGRPSPPGEIGRVVITPFRSFAQPLIRYDQGDFAVRGAPCLCGRGLSVIERLAGRVRHIFHRSDGTLVVPWLPDHATTAFNALMFQVAQTAPGRLEVRYQPKREGTNPVAMAEGLRVLMQVPIEIAFRVVDGFDIPPGGKHLEFVNEIEASR